MSLLLPPLREILKIWIGRATRRPDSTGSDVVYSNVDSSTVFVWFSLTVCGRSVKIRNLSGRRIARGQERMDAIAHLIRPTSPPPKTPMVEFGRIVMI